MGRRRTRGWLGGSLTLLSTSSSSFRAGGCGTASTPGYLHYQGHGSGDMG